MRLSTIRQTVARFTADHAVLLAFVTLALTAFLLYRRTLSGYFLADDFANVVLTSTYDLRRWPGMFFRDAGEGIWGFSLQALRPFAALFAIVEGRLFQGHALPYRVTSLALHFGNACLVFLLARRWLSANVGYAFAAALLFAVHPVQAEPVAWISGQSDLLPTFFFLAAVLTFVRFRENGKGADAIACLGCGFVAIFAKENSVVLPMLFAAHDLIHWRDLARIRSWKSGAKLLALYLGYAAILGAYFSCRAIAFGGGGGVPPPGNALQVIFATLPARYFEYLEYLWAPLQLSPYMPSRIGFRASSVVAILLIAAAFACLVLALRRDRWHALRPLAFAGPVWFMVTTLPFLLTYSSSRHLYLVSAGFCIFAVIVVKLFVGGRRWMIAAAVLAGVAVAWIHTNQRVAAPWIRAAKITRMFHQQVASVASAPSGTALIVELPHNYEHAYTFAWTMPYPLDAPFYRPSLRDRFIVVSRPASYYHPGQWHMQPGLAELADRAPAEAYLIDYNFREHRPRLRKLDPARVQSASEQLHRFSRGRQEPPHDAHWDEFIKAVK